MANYTISEFISHAQAGDPIAITKKEGNIKVVIKIGAQAIELVDSQTTRLLTGSEGTNSTLFGGTLDLGTLFSANQVLESLPLRQAIIEGLVTAAAGSVALSVVPVA